MVYINKGSRSYVNQNEIDKMETIYTERVPKTPQGPAKYKVKYNDADPLLPVADNWRWGRAQPCKRSGFCKGGRRTLQVCRGSLLCTNANCPFLKIEKTPNKADFIRGDRCMHCNAAATETPCTARKYVENDRCHKTITVIYLYKHSCNPRQAEEKPKKETLEDILRSQPTKTAGQIQLDVIREALLSDKCGDEVNNVALSYSNRTHIQYVKNTINKEKRPGGSDIEAIRLLREDFISRRVDWRRFTLFFHQNIRFGWVQRLLWDSLTSP